MACKEIIHAKLGFFPIRLAYTFLVIGAFLVLVAFFWYIMFEIVMPVRWGAMQALSLMESNNSTDQILTYADTFMTNIWKFLLVFGVITLALWAFTYSQEKGKQI